MMEIIEKILIMFGIYVVCYILARFYLQVVDHNKKIEAKKPKTKNTTRTPTKPTYNEIKNAAFANKK